MSLKACFNMFLYKEGLKSLLDKKNINEKKNAAGKSKRIHVSANSIFYFFLKREMLLKLLVRKNMQIPYFVQMNFQSPNQVNDGSNV